MASTKTGPGDDFGALHDRLDVPGLGQALTCDQPPRAGRSGDQAELVIAQEGCGGLPGARPGPRRQQWGASGQRDGLAIHVRSPEHDRWIVYVVVWGQPKVATRAVFPRPGDVPEPIRDPSVDLSYQVPSINDIEDDSHADVQDGDKRGDDGCDTCGVCEPGPGTQPGCGHAGKIRYPMPRTVSIRTWAVASLARRRARCTSIVFEPTAAASSSHT